MKLRYVDFFPASFELFKRHVNSGIRGFLFVCLFVCLFVLFVWFVFFFGQYCSKRFSSRRRLTYTKDLFLLHELSSIFKRRFCAQRLNRYKVHSVSYCKS